MPGKHAVTVTKVEEIGYNKDGLVGPRGLAKRVARSPEVQPSGDVGADSNGEHGRQRPLAGIVVPITRGIVMDLHHLVFGRAVAAVLLIASAATAAAAPESCPMHRAGPEEIRDLAPGAGDAKNQDEGYGELSPRDETWFGSTFWTGPDWTRVGKDWQHSGENTPSVRRWTAPRDGRVTITGRVYKADTEQRRRRRRSACDPPRPPRGVESRDQRRRHQGRRAESDA